MAYQPAPAFKQLSGIVDLEEPVGTRPRLTTRIHEAGSRRGLRGYTRAYCRWDMDGRGVARGGWSERAVGPNRKRLRPPSRTFYQGLYRIRRWGQGLTWGTFAIPWLSDTSLREGERERERGRFTRQWLPRVGRCGRGVRRVGGDRSLCGDGRFGTGQNTGRACVRGGVRCRQACGRAPGGGAGPMD